MRKKLLALAILPLSLTTLAWGFDAPTFLEKTQELKSATKFSSGKYIQGGLYAQAIAGINQQMAFAALGPKDQKKLAAYCVGGQVVTSSAGVGGAGETGQTLGCKSIDDYSGAFLSFSVGGKFLLGATVSYSLGLDVHSLLNHLSQWLQQSSAEDRQQLKNSLALTLKYLSDHHQSFPEFDLLILILNKFMPDLIDAEDYEQVKERLAEEASELSTSLNEDEATPSLGGRIKKALKEIRKVFIAANGERHPSLPFVEGLASFFTGCDSIGIAGDVGLSVGGGFSVQLSDYVLLSSVDYRYVEKLDFEINRLWSDNPELDQISYKKALKEVGRFSKEIGLSAYQCSIKAQANTMGYVGQAKALMKKKKQ